MNHGIPPLLGSIEAIRPVFMIVMGVFLMVIAWRLCKSTTGWTARAIASGAFLLGFGYALLMPLYESGTIERYSARGQYRGSAATATAWHAVKIVSMNASWLVFGLGLAMHARVFTASAPRSKVTLTNRASHESLA